MTNTANVSNLETVVKRARRWRFQLSGNYINIHIPVDRIIEYCFVLLEFPELAYFVYAHRKWDEKVRKSLAVMPGG